MSTAAVKDTILQAIQHEKDTRQLRERLSTALPRIKEKLVIPEHEPIEALLAFISGYIESIPCCLTRVTDTSERMGFSSYAAPFVHIAEDYLLQPPVELPAEEGLETLMDGAFLAHRLLEEVNDHHIRLLKRPLLPVDMTEANIIVHHLIGDKLATRLDQLVQLTAAVWLEREGSWDQVRALPATATPPDPALCSASLSATLAPIGLRVRDLH